MMNREDRAYDFFLHEHDDKLSQTENCLRYLELYGEITPLEALTAFGCFRLSAVIFNLRNDGYDIDAKINEGKKKYAIYTLKGDEE